MTATNPRSFPFIALLSTIFTLGSVSLSVINYSAVLLYTGGAIGILTLCYHLTVAVVNRQKRSPKWSSSEPLCTAASTPSSFIGCGTLVMWAVLLALQVEVLLNGPTRSALVLLAEGKGKRVEGFDVNVQKLLPVISGTETIILAVYVCKCFVHRARFKLGRWENEQRISKFPLSTTSSDSALSAGDEEKTIGSVSDVIWDVEPPKVQRYNSTSPRGLKVNKDQSPPSSIASPPARGSLSRLPKARLSLRRARQPQWEFMTPMSPAFDFSYADGNTEKSGRGIEGQYSQR